MRHVRTVPPGGASDNPQAPGGRFRSITDGRPGVYGQVGDLPAEPSSSGSRSVEVLGPGEGWAGSMSGLSCRPAAFLDLGSWADMGNPS